MDEWLQQKPRVGNYEPFLRLAAGGMGAVYLARQVGAAGFERLVVVKRVHPHLLAESTFLDMVRDEARISSLIRHAHVVPVVDVVDVNRELFLVLEYVESIALSSLVKAHRAAREVIPPGVVARILCDMLAGLHAAHEACDLTGTPLGVVHRDVSPHNVLVGSDGAARLIDFGIAKAESRLTVTKSGSLKGKLRYMSPEQIRQQPVDRRSDVYAAGVVLYEAVTGRAMFTGPDEGAVLMQVLTGDVVAPTAAARGIPAAIDAIVARATNTDPALRFATAAEFQEALEAAVPLASLREVRALVERHAHAAFVERRTAIEAHFQSARASSGKSEPLTAPSLAAVSSSVEDPDDSAVTRVAEPAAQASEPPARARRLWIPLVAVALVSAVGLVTLLSSRGGPAHDTGHDAPSAAKAEPTPIASAPSMVAHASATVSAEPTIEPATAPAKSAAATTVKKPKPGVTAGPKPDLHKNPYEAN